MSHLALRITIKVIRVKYLWPPEYNIALHGIPIQSALPNSDSSQLPGAIPTMTPLEMLLSSAQESHDVLAHGNRPDTRPRERGLAKRGPRLIGSRHIECTRRPCQHGSELHTRQLRKPDPRTPNVPQLLPREACRTYWLSSHLHWLDRARPKESGVAQRSASRRGTRDGTRRPRLGASEASESQQKFMIAKEDLTAIHQKTTEFWIEHVSEPSFSSLFSGKEIGHRVADYVDETTVAFLEKHFHTGRQRGTKGNVRARSMGDIWIYSNGMYNPVNVKAGEYGTGGQPNLVSLTKLIDGLVRRQIDSYYLLFVKAERQGALLVPHVYLVDMLDYLDFVTFDAGPGQTMLRERQFFDAVMTGYEPPSLSIAEKLERLFGMLEDGDARLIRNRMTKMERMRKTLLRYRKVDNHDIDQKGLDIG